MEAPPGFEPGVEVLQTSALPLGDGAPWVEIARIVNACSDSDHTVTGWRTVLAVLLAECGGIEITGVSLSDALTASKARRWRATTCHAYWAIDCNGPYAPATSAYQSELCRTAETSLRIAADCVF